MREAPAMREAIEHLDRTPVEMKFATHTYTWDFGHSGGNTMPAWLCGAQHRE